MLSQREVEELRKDFPCLHLRHPGNGRFPIYLDSSCVSLKPSPVADAEVGYLTRHPSCGGHRSEHWFAEQTEIGVEAARAKIAALFNIQPVRGSDGRSLVPLIITRNATEGLNLVARSLGLMPGETVLLTNKEHNSNLCPWQELARTGVHLRYVLAGSDNRFSVQSFEHALRGDRTIKVVAMHQSSNLDGVTTPLTEIVAAVRNVEREQGRTIYVCIDGAQSAPHQRLNLGNPQAPDYLDVDFFAASLHKMLGPSGIGVLYGKPELLDCLPPFLVGGSTIFETSAHRMPIYAEWPARFEAGLQNYGGIIAAGAAADYLAPLLPTAKEYESFLNGVLTESLSSLRENGRIRLLGPTDARERGGVFTFMLPDAPDGSAAKRLRAAFHENNVMCRTGQFCVNVWFSTQTDLPRDYSVFRLSSYLYNTLEEIEMVAELVRSTLSGPKSRERPRSNGSSRASKAPAPRTSAARQPILRHIQFDAVAEGAFNGFAQITARCSGNSRHAYALYAKIGDGTIEQLAYRNARVDDTAANAAVDMSLALEAFCEYLEGRPVAEIERINLRALLSAQGYGDAECDKLLRQTRGLNGRVIDRTHAARLGPMPFALYAGGVLPFVLVHWALTNQRIRSILEEDRPIGPDASPDRLELLVARLRSLPEFAGGQGRCIELAVRGLRTSSLDQSSFRSAYQRALFPGLLARARAAGFGFTDGFRLDGDQALRSELSWASQAS
ncbi:MAG: aminotransferase class V-fold PLP-dependent enzyme [Myxococcota bacterium]